MGPWDVKCGRRRHVTAAALHHPAHKLVVLWTLIPKENNTLDEAGLETELAQFENLSRRMSTPPVRSTEQSEPVEQRETASKHPSAKHVTGIHPTTSAGHCTAKWAGFRQLHEHTFLMYVLAAKLMKRQLRRLSKDPICSLRFMTVSTALLSRRFNLYLNYRLHQRHHPFVAIAAFESHA
jgi:hypothetical protein